MNNVCLVGRLTKDPEQRTTQSGIAVTSFTVAVQRRFKDADGSYHADFINCVAWRQTAEFIAKYFSKGSKIGVSGSLQTRTYDDANGVKRYVTEVIVDEAEFVQSKCNGKQQDQQGTENALLEDSEDFQPLDDAELPF